MRWGMHDPGFLCTFFTRAIMSAKSRGINWSFRQSPLKIEKLKPYIVSAWQPRNGYNCEQCICEWVCVCVWLFVWPVCVTDMVSNIPTVHADAKKTRQSSIWSQPTPKQLSNLSRTMRGPCLGNLGDESNLVIWKVAAASSIISIYINMYKYIYIIFPSTIHHPELSRSESFSSSWRSWSQPPLPRSQAEFHALCSGTPEANPKNHGENHAGGKRYIVKPQALRFSSHTSLFWTFPELSMFPLFNVSNM